MMNLRSRRRSFQAAFFLFTFLSQIYAEEKECSLCPGGSTPTNNLDDMVLSSDGRTCGQLEIEALWFDQTDPICGSFYQVIGFSSCGCTYEEPNDSSSCSLCPDGSVPNSQDSIYHSAALATCGQVQEFLQYAPQSIESCDAIQHQGIVNCGCPHIILYDPKCNLCENDEERVSNPDAEVIETAGVSVPINTTCGVLEYILAKDVENQYNSDTCNLLKDRISTQCSCSDPPMTINPTKSPVAERYTSIPSSSSNPTSFPSVAFSSRPSVGPSPSRVSSSSPTFLPSATPTAHISSDPSTPPSSIPSVVPTLSPSTIPSVTPSRKPSLLPSPRPSVTSSSHPTATTYPSFSPTSIMDLEPNCTALRNGIVPEVEDLAESTTFNLYFDLFVESDPVMEFPTNYTSLEIDLKQIFDRRISAITAGCPNTRRRLGEIAEKIHFVQMNSLSQLMDGGCTSNFASVQEGAEFDILCVPMESSITVYFSPPSAPLGRRILVAANDVKAHVSEIVQLEFASLLEEVSGVYGGFVVNSFADPKVISSNQKQVAIGVGIGCSAVLVVAVAILTLVKGKRGASQESTNIVAEGHIRSDDSISDNPTISSGRRAMMTGWEGSVQSNRSDDYSEYSKRSNPIKLDDGSSDAKRAYSYEGSSYLPSNVLKDLLGYDDDLSLGPDDTIEI